jgi:hypothetical protein
VLFLAGSAANGIHEERHDQYLKAFWLEELDDSRTPEDRAKGPDTVSRKHILGYIGRVLAKGLDPSRHMQVSRTLSHTYSGYVHGASSHIMQMCVGLPPRLLVLGMMEVPERMDEHGYDAWNYYYRALMTLNAAAKAFGDVELSQHLYDAMDDFEVKTGRKEGERRNPKASTAPATTTDSEGTSQSS